MISLYYDYISLLFNFLRNFRVKYQESSIGFENLAHLQSIENKCNFSLILKVGKNGLFLVVFAKCYSFQNKAVLIFGRISKIPLQEMPIMP